MYPVSTHLFVYWPLLYQVVNNAITTSLHPTCHFFWKKSFSVLVWRVLLKNFVNLVPSSSADPFSFQFPRTSHLTTLPEDCSGPLQSYPVVFSVHRCWFRSSSRRYGFPFVSLSPFLPSFPSLVCHPNQLPLLLWSLPDFYLFPFDSPTSTSVFSSRTRRGCSFPPDWGFCVRHNFLRQKFHE